MTELELLQQQIIGCRTCTRLVEWREQVGRDKVKRYADQDYWAKAVPSFGKPDAEVLIIGLAPGAHGSNRTGRMFTGDGSGNFLYPSLYRTGFATQPDAFHKEDSLELMNCYITALAHCAPPANKLQPGEKANCRNYLLRELKLLKNVKVIICLGRESFDATQSALKEVYTADIPKKLKFGHGLEYKLSDKITLIASFHPSLHNTLTGRLTPVMMDEVFIKAQNIVGKITAP